MNKTMAPIILLAACAPSTGGGPDGAASSETGQPTDCAPGNLTGLIEREGELFPDLDVVATSSHDSSPVRTTADAWGAYEIQLAAEVAWSVEAVAKGFCAWEIPLELTLACGEDRTENLQLGNCDTGG